jgi:hypothetical protein
MSKPMTADTIKKLMLFVLAAPFVIFLVHYGRVQTEARDQKHELAQREAIEAQAEAQDTRMDAITAEHKVKIGMTAAQCRAGWALRSQSIA